MSDTILSAYKLAASQGFKDQAKTALRYLSSEAIWDEAVMASSPRIREAAHEVLKERLTATP